MAGSCRPDMTTRSSGMLSVTCAERSPCAVTERGSSAFTPTSGTF